MLTFSQLESIFLIAAVGCANFILIYSLINRHAIFSHEAQDPKILKVWRLNRFLVKTMTVLTLIAMACNAMTNRSNTGAPQVLLLIETLLLLYGLVAIAFVTFFEPTKTE